MRSAQSKQMQYLIGVILAFVVAILLGTTVGFDRGRAFYPTVAIVVAHYYVLFAVMGSSGRILVVEIVIASAFWLIAVLGFKTSLWFVVAALVGHGVFDFTHHLFIQNPGVPLWWPGFCMAFDVVAGGWLAFRLMRVPNMPTRLGR